MSCMQVGQQVEQHTETKRKRLLKKRVREGGLKGDKAAMAPEDADTDDNH